MKIRKYVKKDIIKVTSILILLLGLLTILYLSEIQSISGYVVQINYPNNMNKDASKIITKVKRNDKKANLGSDFETKLNDSNIYYLNNKQII